MSQTHNVLSPHGRSVKDFTFSTSLTCSCHTIHTQKPVLLYDYVRRMQLFICLSDQIELKKHIRLGHIPKKSKTGLYCVTLGLHLQIFLILDVEVAPAWSSVYWVFSNSSNLCVITSLIQWMPFRVPILCLNCQEKKVNVFFSPLRLTFVMSRREEALCRGAG